MGAAIDVADGRVPVIAGIIVDSTRQALEKARALADLDVAALQVTPVHYLFRPTDETMFAHFATLAEQAAQPVMVYNVVPWSYCSPALLDRMMREIPGLIGVKQSAGDLKLLADLLMTSADAGLIMSAVDALLYPSFRPGRARRHRRDSDGRAGALRQAVGSSSSGRQCRRAGDAPQAAADLERHHGRAQQLAGQRQDGAGFAGSPGRGAAHAHAGELGGAAGGDRGGAGGGPGLSRQSTE